MRICERLSYEALPPPSRNKDCKEFCAGVRSLCCFGHGDACRYCSRASSRDERTPRLARCLMPREPQTTRKRVSTSAAAARLISVRLATVSGGDFPRALVYELARLVPVLAVSRGVCTDSYSSSHLSASPI